MSDYIDIMQREDDEVSAASKRRRAKRKSGKKPWSRKKFEKCVRGVKRSNSRRKKKANPWAVCNAAKRRAGKRRGAYEKKRTRRLTRTRKAVHTSHRAGEKSHRRVTRARRKKHLARESSTMARKRKRSCKYGKLKSPRGRKRCRKPRKHAAHHRKSPKRVAAGRKAARTRKRRHGKHTKVRMDPFSGKYYAFEGKRKRRRRKSKRHAAHAAEAPRRHRRRKGSSKRRVSRRRRRPGHHKHSVRGYYRRKSRGSRKRVYVRGHRSHEASRRRRHRHHGRRGAMENPISLMDGVLGGVCGLVGFGAAEVVDRLLATHALKDTGAKDSQGNEIYVDPGDANGHLNPTYVIGPMWGAGQWMRLAAGLGLGVVPLAAGGMIKSSALRSCVQFFGFGALMRTGGKVLSDGVAYLLRSNAPVGQRLFMPEISAQTVLTPASAPAQLTAPAAGGVSVGLMGSGCQCTNCQTGVGACCAAATLAQVQQGTAQRAAGVPQTAPAPNPMVPSQGPTVGNPTTVANPPLTANAPPTSVSPPAASLRGAPLGSGAGKSSNIRPLYNPNIRRVVGE